MCQQRKGGRRLPESTRFLSSYFCFLLYFVTHLNTKTNSLCVKANLAIWLNLIWIYVNTNVSMKTSKTLHNKHFMRYSTLLDTHNAILVSNNDCKTSWICSQIKTPRDALNLSQLANIYKKNNFYKKSGFYFVCYFMFLFNHEGNGAEGCSRACWLTGIPEWDET